MAKIAYKNIGIGKEGATLGSSAALTKYLHVKSLDLRPNENKIVLDDTSSSFRGGLRYHRERVTVEGSLEMYASPANLIEAFELVCGASNGGAAAGTSATQYTYSVANGDYMSKWIRVDDGVNIEDFHGLRAKSMVLDFADNGSISLELIGQGYTSASASITDTIDKLPPFTLGEVRVWIGASTNILGTSTMTELVSHDVKVEYDNGLEGTHQSGARTIRRSDPKIPTLKVSFKRFYEDTTLRDNALQTETNYAMRIEGILATPVIVGTTPYYFRIDMPMIQVQDKPERSYSAGEYVIEEVMWQGVVDPTSGNLWQPYVVTNN